MNVKVSTKMAESKSALAVKLLKSFLSNYLFIVLIGIVVLGSILSPYFLTSRNIGNVLTFAAVVSIIAVGQFFVIVTGGIDLSVGSMVALSTVIAAVSMKSGASPFMSSIFALLITSGFGGLSGLLVIKAKIAPFIATLAMMSIVRGVSYLVQISSLISIRNEGFISFFAGKTLGVSHPVIIFVFLMLVSAFVMKYTTYGRRLYAIGGNAEAARLSGLSVDNTIFSVYLLNGFLAGLAGLILAAQLTQGSSLLATGYELDAIAAVVVGGASLSGGSGNPIKAVAGGLVIAILGNIMNLMTIPSEPQQVVKGGLIIIAVIFIGGEFKQNVQKKRKMKSDNKYSA
ncbi:MAG: ABC transporter permease [Peptostreptococcaceae bacterium]|nr:ABC transporter permease [Peptostreptococcaceae bacterium]